MSPHKQTLPNLLISGQAVQAEGRGSGWELPVCLSRGRGGKRSGADAEMNTWSVTSRQEQVLKDHNLRADEPIVTREGAWYVSQIQIFLNHIDSNQHIS